MLKVPLALIPALLIGCSDMSDSAVSDYTQEINAWHAERVESLQSETGWLTLAGLHPLTNGEYTIGSDPANDIVIEANTAATIGTLSVSSGIVTLNAAPDAAVTSSGEPITKAVMQSDATGDPSVLESGSVLMHVIERGGAPFLRVRDRESATLQAFDGVDRFPVNEAWRVTATLDTSNAGKIDVTNLLGQIEQADSPGVLMFELAGQDVTLQPTTSSDGSLFIVFGDETNGTETYGAGRFLSAGAPDADGRVELDFNRAFNMVCAFTAHAACPMPPAGNRLALRVEAGEKTPTKH